MSLKNKLLNGVSKGTIIKSKTIYNIGLNNQIKKSLDKVNSKLPK